MTNHEHNTRAAAALLPQWAQVLIDACDSSDAACHGTLATSWVRNIVDEFARTTPAQENGSASEGAAVAYECGYCGEPLESDRVVSCRACGKMTHRHGIKIIPQGGAVSEKLAEALRVLLVDHTQWFQEGAIAAVKGTRTDKARRLAVNTLADYGDARARASDPPGADAGVAK